MAGNHLVGFPHSCHLRCYSLPSRRSYPRLSQGFHFHGSHPQHDSARAHDDPPTPPPRTCNRKSSRISSREGDFCGSSSPLLSVEMESGLHNIDVEVLQASTKAWLERTLNEAFTTTSTIIELLSSGELLKKLTDHVRIMLYALDEEKGIVRPTINISSPLGLTWTNPFSRFKLPYKNNPNLFSNADSFLRLCRELKIEEKDTFTLAELSDAKYTQKICLCFRALCIKVQEAGCEITDFDGVLREFLHPKLQKVLSGTLDDTESIGPADPIDTEPVDDALVPPIIDPPKRSFPVPDPPPPPPPPRPATDDAALKRLSRALDYLEKQSGSAVTTPMASEDNSFRGQGWSRFSSREVSPRELKEVSPRTGNKQKYPPPEELYANDSIMYSPSRSEDVHHPPLPPHLPPHQPRNYPSPPPAPRGGDRGRHLDSQYWKHSDDAQSPSGNFIAYSMPLKMGKQSQATDTVQQSEFWDKSEPLVMDDIDSQRMFRSQVFGDHRKSIQDSINERRLNKNSESGSSRTRADVQDHLDKHNSVVGSDYKDVNNDVRKRYEEQAVVHSHDQVHRSNGQYKQKSANHNYRYHESSENHIEDSTLNTNHEPNPDDSEDNAPIREKVSGLFYGRMNDSKSPAREKQDRKPDYDQSRDSYRENERTLNPYSDYQKQKIYRALKDYQGEDSDVNNSFDSISSSHRRSTHSPSYFSPRSNAHSKKTEEDRSSGMYNSMSYLSIAEELEAFNMKLIDAGQWVKVNSLTHSENQIDDDAELAVQEKIKSDIEAITGQLMNMMLWLEYKSGKTKGNIPREVEKVKEVSQPPTPTPPRHKSQPDLQKSASVLPSHPPEKSKWYKWISKGKSKHKENYVSDGSENYSSTKSEGGKKFSRFIKKYSSVPVSRQGSRPLSRSNSGVTDGEQNVKNEIDELDRSRTSVSDFEMGWKKEKENGKPKGRNRSKSGTLSWFKYDKEKEEKKERELENQRKQLEAAMERERKERKERERIEKEKQLEWERERQAAVDKEKEKDREKEREKERERLRLKDIEKEIEMEKERERAKEREREKQRELEKERERELEREREKQRELELRKKREMDSEMDIEKQFEIEMEKARERERQRNEWKEAEREINELMLRSNSKSNETSNISQKLHSEKELEITTNDALGLKVKYKSKSGALRWLSTQQEPSPASPFNEQGNQMKTARGKSKSGNIKHWFTGPSEPVPPDLVADFKELTMKGKQSADLDFEIQPSLTQSLEQLQASFAEMDMHKKTKNRSRSVSGPMKWFGLGNEAVPDMLQSPAEPNSRVGKSFGRRFGFVKSIPESKSEGNSKRKSKAKKSVSGPIKFTDMDFAPEIMIPGNPNAPENSDLAQAFEYYGIGTEYQRPISQSGPLFWHGTDLSSKDRESKNFQEGIPESGQEEDTNFSKDFEVKDGGAPSGTSGARHVKTDSESDVDSLNIYVATKELHEKMGRQALYSLYDD